MIQEINRDDLKGEHKMESDWGTIVGEFSVRMLNRFIRKDRDGWGNWTIITEHEYKKRAIKNILDGDYVDAANLCLLADKVQGT